MKAVRFDTTSGTFDKDLDAFLSNPEVTVYSTFMVGTTLYVVCVE